MWPLIFALAIDTTGVRRITLTPSETLAVTISGVGAPVVLVPGLFGAAYGFRHLVPGLVAAGYRVIVIEPLAVGSSSRPRRADYSLDAQANRISAVLDTLGVSGAILVGHSLGAALAMRVAAERPDLAAVLVSLEGGPAERAATASMRRALQFAPLIKLVGGMRIVRRNVRTSLRRASGDTTWVTDEVIAEYTAGAAHNLDGTILAYLAMTDAREHQPLEPRLSRIRCPFLLMLGAAPHGSGPDEAAVNRLRQLVPQLEVSAIDGAGHYLHEEQPDDVLRVLLELPRAISATARSSSR